MHARGLCLHGRRKVFNATHVWRDSRAISRFNSVDLRQHPPEAFEERFPAAANGWVAGGIANSYARASAYMAARKAFNTTHV